MDFLQNNIQIKGYKEGYIPEGKTGERPVNSVIACKNLDFENGYTRRRKPYSSYYDLSSLLPAGYSIKKWILKKFSDADSNIAECLIIAAKDNSDKNSRLRLFINKYFNPSSEFTNNHTLRAKDISGITHSSGIVTITTVTNHGYSAGSKFQIEDVTGTFTPALTGVYEILGTPTANVLTFALSMSTCTYTSGGRVNILGFEDTLTELTEMYSGTLNSVSAVGDKFTTIKITNSTGKSKNYYKSFNVLRNGLFRGIIVDYSNDGTDDIFTIAREPGLALEVDDDVMLVRFPVVFFNLEKWKNIKDISFEDTSNALKINCGHEENALWLGLLAEKSFFGNLPSITDSGKTYKTDWNGFWFTYDQPIVPNKKELFSNSVTTTSYTIIATTYQAGIFRVYLNVPMNSTIIHNGSNVVLAGIPTDLYDNNPNGTRVVNYVSGSSYFQIDFNAGASGPVHEHSGTASIEAGTGDVQYYYAQLGILLRGTYSIIDVDSDKRYSEIWDTCLEIDHRETFFVKRLIGKAIEGNNKRSEYYNKINFFTFFERRITAIKNFYDRYDIGINEISDLEKPTYLLGDDYYGTIDTNADDLFFLDELSSQIEVGVKLNNFPKNGNSTFESADRGITPNLSIDSYLGYYHYKEAWTKVKQFINVDENIIGINLSPDSPKNNYGSEKSGGNNKVVLAAIQQGAINCFSSFPEDRIRQITKSDSLIGGAKTSGAQFLLWTNSNMTVCEITSPALGTIAERFTHEGQGIYSMDSVVVATTLEDDPIISARKQYFGTFYNTFDSFYRFFNGAYIDIAHLRIKNEYQALSENIKANIKGVFYPNKKEIWWLINGKIYIYCILFDNWKLYEFPDAIENLGQDSTGQILFNTGNKIYRTEAEGTTLYKDKGNTAIEFFLEQVINHGDSSRAKIPSFLSLNFDMIPEYSFGEPLTASLRVEIFKENTSTKVMDRVFNAGEKLIKRITVDKNKHCLYYRIRISSYTDAANIKSFTLNEMEATANYTGRTLSTT